MSTYWLTYWKYLGKYFENILKNHLRAPIIVNILAIILKISWEIFWNHFGKPFTSTNNCQHIGWHIENIWGNILKNNNNLGKYFENTSGNIFENPLLASMIVNILAKILKISRVIVWKLLGNPFASSNDCQHIGYHIETSREIFWKHVRKQIGKTLLTTEHCQHISRIGNFPELEKIFCALKANQSREYFPFPCSK